MNKDEALKMAIEALEFIKDGGFYTGHDDCIQACKEALATEQVRDDDVQPAQEPVAFTNKDELSELKSGMTTCYMYKQAIDDDDIALYTHPAPAWQGLSDECLDEIVFNCGLSATAKDIVRAIEQELKTKNGFSDVKEKNHVAI